MSTMTLFFHHKATVQRYKKLDEEASKVHRDTIKKIDNARVCAEDLRKVVEENGITLTIARATRKHA